MTVQTLPAVSTGELHRELRERIAAAFTARGWTTWREEQGTPSGEFVDGASDLHLAWALDFPQSNIDQGSRARWLSAPHTSRAITRARFQFGFVLPVDAGPDAYSDALDAETQAWTAIADALVGLEVTTTPVSSERALADTQLGQLLLVVVQWDIQHHKVLRIAP